MGSNFNIPDPSSTYLDDIVMDLERNSVNLFLLLEKEHEKC